MAALVCRSCGATLAPDARFCASCGAAAEAGCASCGAPLAEGARFCSACGTPVGAAVEPVARAAVEPVRERKVATLLFADLVGFTALGEAHDPEHVGALVG